MNKMVIIVMAAALILSKYVAASEPRLLPEDDIAAVEIYMIPDGESYVTHINETILQQEGCHYFIRKKEKIISLSESFKNAVQGNQTKEDIALNFELRNKMIFHYKSGPDAAVSFSRKYSNLPYLLGSWEGNPVRLRIDLLDETRRVINSEKASQVNQKRLSSCSSNLEN